MESAAQPEKKKNKKEWVVLIIAFLLLLVVGGVGVGVAALIASFPNGFGNRPLLSGSIDSPFDCNVEYPAGADEQKMADYINSIIPSSSHLKGLGADFVSTAKAGNKNPLFIAHFAEKESSWGMAGIAQANTNNPFGRTATSSQPHVEINGRLWYKFDSWEEAINAEGPYLKSGYQDQGLHTIQGIINKYCPPSECDTQTYIAEARSFISNHTQKANGAFGADPCVTVNLAGAGGPHSGSMTWPLPGHYALSDHFGSPRKSGPHSGIDIPAPGGTTIVATANGTVHYYQSALCGTGMIIDHQNGIQTTFCHFPASGGYLVSDGTAVQAGQPVAIVDSTGNSTGNHLHFGVKVNNKFVDPCSKFVSC